MASFETDLLGLSNCSNQSNFIWDVLFYDRNPYPGDPNWSLNITCFPDNLTTLTFPVSKWAAIQGGLNLAATILDPSACHFQVSCIYPLSGQYDVLNRMLFYTLLFFSLAFRHHDWLVATALGTAMTYSAVSAIHVFTFLVQFGWGMPVLNEHWVFCNKTTSQPYGDIDLFGAWPILIASAITFAQILNWSISVQRNEAQIIVVLWGCLVFTALVPTFTHIYQFKFNPVLNTEVVLSPLTQIGLNSVQSVTLCPGSSIPGGHHLRA